MESPKNLNNKIYESKRKPYIQPQVEIVPLLPKQTVLDVKCFSISLNAAETFQTCTLLNNCAQ